MKRRNLFPFIVILLLIPGLLFLVNGCKKQDTGMTAAQADELANAKTALKEKIAKEGRAVTIPVNQKITAFYADQNGNEVPKEVLLARRPGRSNAAASIISACDYSNSPTVLLNSYSIYSDCATGYKVSWNYTVSTNNNIVATSSYNSSQVTKGKFYIYDNNNTLVYSNLSVTPATVTDMGADPANFGYELFSVTFNTGLLPPGVFNTSYTTKLGALIMTDCSDFEPFPIALQNYSATAYQYPSTQPCSRIDPFYLNNYTKPLRVWGEDPIGSCAGTGYVYPNWQEINFSVNGGAWFGGSLASPAGTLTYYFPPSNWAPYPNLSGSSLGGYVDPYGVFIVQLNLAAGATYSISMRSRNIVYNNPPSYYGGVWPLPNAGVNCCVGAWSATTTMSVAY